MRGVIRVCWGWCGGWMIKSAFRAERMDRVDVRVSGPRSA